MRQTKYFLGIAVILLLFSLVSGYHGSVAWTQIIMWSSLLAFVVKLGLAIWIYRRNPSAKVNKYFALVFVGQAIWDLGKFLMWLTPDESMAFIWARISYSGYIISLFFLLEFVWAYLKKKHYFTTVPGRIVLYTPMVLLLLALWFKRWMIADLVPPEALSYGFGIELWNYTYGPLYNYFFMWFQVIPFIYAFVLFVFKYFFVKSEDKKKQLFYLVVGSSFPIMLGIPTGVILPSMGIFLPPHNNILSLIMSIFIAIGIIKYKFLAVRPIGEKIVEGRKLEHALADEYKFEFGNSYFIKHEKSSEISHKVLLTHLYKKRYGLIITAHNPGKVRHEYGIETTPIVWMTDTETEHLAVDPIDIEQLYETIKQFVEKVPQSFVLIDGLDYLLVHNNFAKIMHFMKKVRGVVTRNNSCLVVPKGALAVDLKKERLLEADNIVLPRAKAERSVAKETAGKRKAINYVIIGHTPLAQSIISEFEKRSIKPTVIEKTEILVHYPKGAVRIVKGDPLSRKVLEHAGIDKPNTVALITLEHDSDVILCINKIRQRSESVKIVTNIHNQDFIAIATKAGGDKVIPSSSIGGRLISLALTSPDIVRWVMDATTLAARELELVEVMVNGRSAFSGKTVGEVDRKLGKTGNVIALRNPEGLQQIPDDKYKLQQGDVLVMVVDLKILPKGKTVSDRIFKAAKKGR